MYFRRFERLQKRINNDLSRLQDAQELFGIFFYPDSQKPCLSDSEYKKLMQTIDSLHMECKNTASFAKLLRVLINEKGFTANDVYTHVLMDKSYFYQILRGNCRPSRDLAIRICLTMRLNIAESENLLNTLGYGFYKKCKRDIIIMECLRYKAGLDTTEELLDKYKENHLCGDQ